MTTLPTESVLNWSSQKPTLESIKGKPIVIYRKGNIFPTFYHSLVLFSVGDYELWFDKNFLKYAIIAEPLEAKELWGVKPEIMHNGGGLYYLSYKSSGWFIQSMSMPKDELITAWNQLVAKIEGER